MSLEWMFASFENSVWGFSRLAAHTHCTHLCLVMCNLVNERMKKWNRFCWQSWTRLSTASATLVCIHICMCIYCEHVFKWRIQYMYVCECARAHLYVYGRYNHIHANIMHEFERHTRTHVYTQYTKCLNECVRAATLAYFISNLMRQRTHFTNGVYCE